MHYTADNDYTNGTSHFLQHKKQHYNYTQFNNLAYVSIQGQRFTHTLRVLSTTPEGN